MDIGPRCRHIVVKDRRQWPLAVTHETPLFYETVQGLFGKISRTKLGEPDVTFDGPFTATGEPES